MSKNSNIVQLAPFLMSSVPKSGTHLLHQVLNGMPNLTNDINNMEKKFFIDHHVKDINIFKDHFYRLAQLQPNEFGVGHMFHSDVYASMLSKLNLKHVFIFRDPRDVLVSLSYFIPNKWNEHPLYNEFNHNLTVPKERMITLIQGIKDCWPNFDDWNRPFYNWITDSNTLAISFEDLMLSNESRYKTITKVVQYLWGDTTPIIPFEKMVPIMVANINPSESNTFRKGKIGSWREEFDNEIKEKFKEVAGNLLIDAGYETDNNW
ncbi:hypothetical protein JOC75_001137 [Metabacillus crassostreae]|uniref:sulfotransferase domain-containing protein n=1 Tax=Metabacillus crassostreae TaxID=929098 RepID=UPI001957BD41|nr:sulfotransferase domain-containing protein [Metabacillus crassostreae]MBM7603167.1 hypothetical protein [Metabacillus crassostreae]